jgi:hypothetical protein
MKLRQAKKILNKESKKEITYRNTTWKKALYRVDYRSFSKYFGLFLKTIGVK